MQTNHCADRRMRLDRLLCALAFGSRSEVRGMIRAGRVRLNGSLARQAELIVQPGNTLEVDDAVIDARTTRHVLLHKPCGVLTAARDPKQQTVLDLLPPVYTSLGCMPVGRLDKDTSGLLLLTTDGALSHLLLSPKRHVWKCYEAAVDGPLCEADALAFAQGLELSDFTALPARLEIMESGPESALARVWVREGKYHQVRRMFAARNRTVTALKRISFGPLTLEDSLAPGESRELSPEELQALYQAAKGEGSPDE